MNADLPAELRVLDFGGGDGSIALHMAGKFLKAGTARAKISVVDHNPEIATCDDQRIVLTKLPTFERAARQQYEVILASAILEHLQEPKRVLLDLLQLLPPGGVLYARTPYIVPLLTLFQRFGMRFDFTFPAHLHDLGPRFWDSVVDSADCRDFSLVVSRPSLVETAFRGHFARTLAAHVLKAPWFVLGKKWPFVGGWEVLVKRNP